MTEVIEQMGIPEHIDDFKVHFRMSRDTFYIVLESIQDTLIRNGKGPHEAVSPEKQLLVCLGYLASIKIATAVSKWHFSLRNNHLKN
jgi:hypothetical protein